MRRFVEWLEVQGITQRYTFAEDRDAYLPTIDAFFPEAKLLQQIEQERQREAAALKLREKYSGQLVMRLFPHLQGKELGEFMRNFQAQWADYEAVLGAMEAEEVVAQLLSFQRTE